MSTHLYGSGREGISLGTEGISLGTECTTWSFDFRPEEAWEPEAARWLIAAFYDEFESFELSPVESALLMYIMGVLFNDWGFNSRDPRWQSSVRLRRIIRETFDPSHPIYERLGITG